MGPSLARQAGRLYRAVFVDLDEVGRVLASVIPRGASVLDVGGGDGAPLNHLLQLRDDILVTTIDPADQVGQWIDGKHAGRVVRRARTTLAEYAAGLDEPPDALLMLDVLHHIPPPERAGVFRVIANLLEAKPGMCVVIKDVEPGSPRALLGYYADRFVTGDANVRPVGRDEVRALVRETIGPLRVEETGLFDADAPNYALVFRR
jgi:2-polyprenyl-3-methyl-5-hydroxy-6-metoxy-1,4-benzoquinol methylase